MIIFEIKNKGRRQNELLQQLLSLTRRPTIQPGIDTDIVN